MHGLAFPASTSQNHKWESWGLPGHTHDWDVMTQRSGIGPWGLRSCCLWNPLILNKALSVCNGFIPYRVSVCHAFPCVLSTWPTIGINWMDHINWEFHTCIHYFIISIPSPHLTLPRSNPTTPSFNFRKQHHFLGLDAYEIGIRFLELAAWEEIIMKYGVVSRVFRLRKWWTRAQDPKVKNNSHGRTSSFI